MDASESEQGAPHHPPARAGGLRIVVVGPCASGKTTLVERLRALGYDAAVCGQEHSEITTLWRHTKPDTVIALRLSLEELRRRRGQDWPRFLYDLQCRRLADAVAHAELTLDASTLNAEEVLAQALAYLESDRPAGSSAGTSGEINSD